MDEDPRLFPVGASDRAMVATHYYRAMVGRADIWRLRMDTTTNWAIGATAGILSIGLGGAAIPHTVVLIAPLMTLSFLGLEARRLTFYHLWQGRVLQLEQALVRPALEGPGDASGAAVGDPEAVARLLAGLGRTVPTMPALKAVARRLRRIYIYLFLFQFTAWGLKLSIHPEPAAGPAQTLARAQIGPVPGTAVVGAVLAFLLASTALVIVRGGRRRTSDGTEPDPLESA